MATYLDHAISSDEIFPGVPLTIIQTPGKALVHFTTVVYSGFFLAGKQYYELPHLLEHLAFEGNTTYPNGKAMSVELETAGVYHNAFTSPDYNWYEFSGPHASLELMQKHVIAQLFEPLFHEQSITQQKKVIDNELHRKREDDVFLTYENVLLAIWDDVASPIDNRIQNLSKIDRQAITDYYARLYRLKNMHFIVCGDLTATEVQAIKDRFADGLKDSPKGRLTPYKDQPNRVSTESVILRRGSSHDVTTFQLRLYRSEADDATLAARRVLRIYLAGGLGSVMQRELREAGLTYNINCFIMKETEHSGISFVDKVPHENVEPLIKACMKYMQDVAEGKIDKTAFARAKGQIMNSQEGSLQRSSDFLGWYFDELRARQPLVSPQQYFDDLAAITEEDLQQVAHKYLYGEGSYRLLSVVTQSEVLKKQKLEKLIAL